MSDCEPHSALGSTGAQDFPATRGFHARPKAVGSLAPNDRRLISTFHGLPALIEKSLILERFACHSVKPNEILENRPPGCG